MRLTTVFFHSTFMRLWQGVASVPLMTLVVIPLFTKRPPTFALRWWVQLVGHVPFVALPITWTARDAAARSDVPG